METLVNVSIFFGGLLLFLILAAFVATRVSGHDGGDA
jgi:hypothetical protein